MATVHSSFELLLAQLLLTFEESTPEERSDMIKELVGNDPDVSIFRDTTGKTIMNYPQFNKNAALEMVLRKYIAKR